MNKQTIRWILIGLLVIVGLYLVIDHGQHLIPYLPFAFLLGCLVMHLFMHGSHGGHGGHHDDSTNKSQ
ncbi:DUF2933 domain-containing protein [Candidatus Parcubacteria bacterium]|nr:MAG: DUF2933 domain-containing protein [Candidatus Parcubacteria bacterium]